MAPRLSALAALRSLNSVLRCDNRSIPQSNLPENLFPFSFRFSFRFGLRFGFRFAFMALASLPHLFVTGDRAAFPRSYAIAHRSLM